MMVIYSVIIIDDRGVHGPKHDQGLTFELARQFVSGLITLTRISVSTSPRTLPMTELASSPAAFTSSDPSRPDLHLPWTTALVPICRRPSKP